MQNRFHANRFGTPAYHGEDVRYWFSESVDGAKDWAVVKAVGGFLVPHKSNGYETGDACYSVKTYLDIISGFNCTIEVTAADLPYLKKPEGEWEFRKLEVGDDYMMMANGSNGYGSMFRDSISGSKGRNRLNGFRWCKPREVDAFEVWWESKDTYARCTYTKEEAARAGWTAALASK